MNIHLDGHGHSDTHRKPTPMLTSFPDKRTLGSQPSNTSFRHRQPLLPRTPNGRRTPKHYSPDHGKSSLNNLPRHHRHSQPTNVISNPHGRENPIANLTIERENPTVQHLYFLHSSFLKDTQAVPYALPSTTQASTASSAANRAVTSRRTPPMLGETSDHHHR